MKKHPYAHLSALFAAIALSACSPDQPNTEGANSPSVEVPVVESKAPKQIHPSIRFSVQGFCDSPHVNETLQASSTLLTRYDTLMGKIMASGDRCVVALNSAEYCQLSMSLGFQAQSWQKLSQAFSDTAILLETATQKNRSVAGQLNALIAGATGEAIDVLELNLEDLRNNAAQNTSDPRLKTAPLEFGEAARVLEALRWAGSVDDAAEGYAHTLANIAEALPALISDSHLALTRTAVLAPKDRQALMDRNHQLGIEIETIRQVFASIAKQEPDAINTEANANNPQAENSGNVLAARDCFNKLALESSIVPEVSTLVKDELDRVRSFDNCPTYTLDSSGLKDQVRQTVAMVDKDAKLFFAASKTVCQ